MKEIIPTTMYRVLVVEDNLGDMDLVREYLSINKDFTYEIIHAEELSSSAPYRHPLPLCKHRLSP